MQNIFKSFQIQLPASSPDREKQTQTVSKLIDRASSSKYRTMEHRHKDVLQKSSRKVEDDVHSANKEHCVDRSQNASSVREDEDYMHSSSNKELCHNEGFQNLSREVDEDVLSSGKECREGQSSTSMEVDGAHSSHDQQVLKDIHPAYRTCVSLDLKQFLIDSGLEQGKGRFDKNIDACRVTDEDGGATPVLHQCACLEDASELSGAKVSTLKGSAKLSWGNRRGSSMGQCELTFLTIFLKICMFFSSKWLFCK